MSWSYDPTLASDRDKVRFYIGDTETSDQQLSNEEITALLSLFGSVERTALQCARGLAAKFARYCDESAGQVSVSWNQRYKAMVEIIAQLESGLIIPGIYAGGISTADKEKDEDDTDFKAPFFTRAQAASESTSLEDPDDTDEDEF